MATEFSAHNIGRDFVGKYYDAWINSPQDAPKFFRDSKSFYECTDRPLDLQNHEIQNLNHVTQECEGGGVIVLVTGVLTSHEKVKINFVETFLLARDHGHDKLKYVVVNAVFMFLNEADDTSPTGVDVNFGDVESASLTTATSEASQLDASEIEEGAEASAAWVDVKFGDVESASLTTATSGASQLDVSKIEEGAEASETAEVNSSPRVKEAFVAADFPVLPTSMAPQLDASKIEEGAETNETAKAYSSPIVNEAFAADFPPLPGQETKNDVDHVTDREPPNKMNFAAFLKAEGVEGGCFSLPAPRPSSSNGMKKTAKEPPKAHIIFVGNLPAHRDKKVVAKEVAKELKKFGRLQYDFYDVDVRYEKDLDFNYAWVKFAEAAGRKKALAAKEIVIGGNKVYIAEKFKRPSTNKSKPSSSYTSHSIFVGNLPAKASRESVEKELKQFGSVTGVQVRQAQGSNFRFAFVYFEDASGKEKALEKKRTFIDGRQVQLQGSLNPSMALLRKGAPKSR